MANFLIAFAVIFTLMSVWIGVQHLARKFAAQHPEFGPVKEEGSGCGKSCDCQAGSCEKQS